MPCLLAPKGFPWHRQDSAIRLGDYLIDDSAIDSCYSTLPEFLILRLDKATLF